MPSRRVFVSTTANSKLDDRRKAVKLAILDKLRAEGFQPQEFWEPGIAAGLGWNFENVNRVMRRCIGAIVIGFPSWEFPESSPPVRLVGEYNQYEGAIALGYGLPVLLLAEKGVQLRGVLWPGGGKAITMIPADADAEWVAGAEFNKDFDVWKHELEERKDVFLGYCSQNAGVAAEIQIRLQKNGATVHNYAMDFRSGLSILNEIEESAAICSAGIFLFGENDPLEGKDGEAAPRDNVVFEAGYFMKANGAERCLIIRQDNAKMPADLGGAIYLHLSSAAGVASIESKLTHFLKENL